jgi:enamine deaminase RidA (YjgF/YER057c/UK114 family)
LSRSQKPADHHAWANEANGMIYSVHVPGHPNGSIEDGDAAEQAEVTLAGLRAALKSVDADLSNVVLVQIHYTSP